MGTFKFVILIVLFSCGYKNDLCFVNVKVQISQVL